MFIIGIILLIIAVISIVVMYLYDIDLVMLAIATLIFGCLFLVASPEKPYTYTAVVKDFDGNQTTYKVKRYSTNGGTRATTTTITLILEDGTKIVAPIQNVIITGQQKGE